MKSKIQIRRGLASDWVSNNPILDIGELGYETDAGGLKVGDGVTKWNLLAYFGYGGAEQSSEILTTVIKVTNAATYQISATTFISFPDLIRDEISSVDPLDYTKLVIPSGVSRVKLSAQVRFQDAGDNETRQIRLFKNGGTVVGGFNVDTMALTGTSTNLNAVSTFMDVVSGDYFQVGFFSGNTPEVTIYDSWFSMESYIPADASKIIDHTYSEMEGLAGTSGFIPGQKYRITDFSTRQYIANGLWAPTYKATENYMTNSTVVGLTGTYVWTSLQDNNLGNTPEEGAWWTQGNVESIYEGPVEPIIVEAVSSTELGPHAYSEDYPTDVLRYDIANVDLNNDPTPYTKGQITYRQSIEDISAWCDWRNVRVRLYRHSVTNQYVIDGDTGFSDGTYQDFPIFGNLIESAAVRIERAAQLGVPEVVFHGRANKVIVGPQTDGLYVVGNCDDSIFASCGKYTFHNECYRFDVAASGGSSTGFECYESSGNVTVLDDIGLVVFEKAITNCVISSKYELGPVDINGFRHDLLAHSDEQYQQGGIWSVNHATLVNGETIFSKGQKYRINNFRTRHSIPGLNYHGAGLWNPTTEYNSGVDYVYYLDHLFICDSSGNLGNAPEVGGNVWWADTGLSHQVGSVEPLIVTAIANNKLSHEAHSESYPKDIIYYDIDASLYHSPGCFLNVESDRGWIYYREDTIVNNSFNYDFRNCRWRRWLNPLTAFGGYKDYHVTVENGEDFIDAMTFDPVYNSSPTYCNGNILGARAFAEDYQVQGNIVFYSGASGCTLRGYGYNYTFLEEVSVLDLGWGNHGGTEGDLGTYGRTYGTTFLRGGSSGPKYGEMRNCSFGLYNMVSSEVGSFLENITTGENIHLSVGSNTIINDLQIAGVPDVSGYSDILIDSDLTITNCKIAVPWSFLTITTNHINESLGVPGGIWSCTYQELLDMVSGNVLFRGQRYKIIDKTNILVEAVSSNEYFTCARGEVDFGVVDGLWNVNPGQYEHMTMTCTPSGSLSIVASTDMITQGTKFTLGIWQASPVSTISINASNYVLMPSGVFPTGGPTMFSLYEFEFRGTAWLMTNAQVDIWD